MLLSDLRDKYNPDKGREDLSRYYMEAYETHFGLRRTDPLHLLEIGVQSGASLRMWRDYFPFAVITGVDINPRCAKHSDDRIQIITGNQGNKGFLRSLPTYDIIIDDGSHQMGHQITSLKILWDHIAPGGIYVVEDLETSYWPQFGGGYGRKNTAVQMLKSNVDTLNHLAVSHKRAEKYRQTLKNAQIKSIHFYPSICFIYKEK